MSLGLSLITLVFICTFPAWPLGGFLMVGVESISILNLFLVSIGEF